MVYKRKYRHGDTHLKIRKDLDQIDEDLNPETAKNLLNQEVDLDKPGCAQFYCLHCARYFVDNLTLENHFRTKAHKRRLKTLEEEPYTIEDAARGAGHGSFKYPQKRIIETQPNKSTSDIQDSPKKRCRID